MPSPRSLEQPEYVALQKRLWALSGAQPLSMKVVEFCGHGDPFFGGGADDRVLGPGGVILNRDTASNRAQALPMEFASIDEAHAAAVAISNRRADSILGVVPKWR